MRFCLIWEFFFGSYIFIYSLFSIFAAVNLKKFKTMEENEKFATYKEFAKMLREVADIYAQLGDEPLLEEGREYNAIRESVQAITNKHDFASYILPWREEFRSMPFSVTKKKKWIAYVNECYRVGKEVDYDKIDEL